MSWLKEALDRLAQAPVCGYEAGGPAAVEPTALAAMALGAHGRPEAAHEALKWLARLQTPSGSLGISAAASSPHWPTGWAVLAWRAAAEWPLLQSESPAESHRAGTAVATGSKKPRDPQWDAAAQRATVWILSAKGMPIDRSPLLLHDSTIVAWSWVEQTHSWVEPTTINLMALKRSGQGDHVRCRDAVRMLVDRMLPSGGWNYGNTVAFGAELRPQVEPTGLALAALAGEKITDPRLARSIAYLNKSLTARTTTVSLCYGLLGLAGQGVHPAEADSWLEGAFRDTMNRGGSPYRLALATLAALGGDCPWFPVLKKVSSLPGGQK